MHLLIFPIGGCQQCKPGMRVECKMDYWTQGALFQLRKVARYLRLYGPNRTWTKVQAQRHMRRTFDSLPESSGDIPATAPIGLIGCGNYAFSTLAYYLRRRFGRVIGAAMDIRPERAASLAKAYGAPMHTTDAAQLLDHPSIRMIYVASNHATHAEYAIEALRRNKHVYIEKPHVVSEDQLSRLCNAMNVSTGRVFLGFNRPGSRFGRLIADYLSRESGSAVFNWFVAGHELPPDHWYLKPAEGGRVLGNLCHWTDFVFQLVESKAFPIRIVPVRTAASDSNLAVNFVFGDGSISAITFSEKGHTFEGVRERFSAHKGNCLLTMDDYEHLTVDVIERKRRYRNWFRDHGHERNIASAYRIAIENQPYDRQAMLRYIANTGWLFLKTREALETNRAITIHSFAECNSNAVAMNAA
jgi:predicted dehydrogenase